MTDTLIFELMVHSSPVGAAGLVEAAVSWKSIAAGIERGSKQLVWLTLRRRMGTLRVRLSTNLCWSQDFPWLFGPNGPLFNRWLPNGREDAIELAVSDNGDRLSIWFDRRGYVDESGFVRFDPKKEECDDSVIAQQGCLDAGPLHGECTLSACSSEELECLRCEKVGTAAYIALGKRVVKFIQPKLTEFIDRLRYQLGQYWLEPLAPWDARRESLGHYCASLGLEWSIDGKAWKRFLPTEMSATVVATENAARGYDQLITKSDWEHLTSALQQGKALHPALVLLGRVGQLVDRGDLRSAFLEANSAAEVALSQCMGSVGQSSELQKRQNEFDKASVSTRLWAVLSLGCSFPVDEMELALHAIDIRNRIAHKGYEVRRKHLPSLMALVRAVAVITKAECFKIPEMPTGNSLSPVGGARIELGVQLQE